MVNTEGAECGQRRLEHVAEAEEFYRSLGGQGVRVGMEASGHARWFERLLAELRFERWIGDGAKIPAAAPRKQKTDARDAEQYFAVTVHGAFEGIRFWIPQPEERDLRQLVLHRHKLVQMGTRVKNQLRAVALNEGMGASRDYERERARAIPAVARKRAVRLWWMWIRGLDYRQFRESGSHAGEPRLQPGQ